MQAMAAAAPPPAMRVRHIKGYNGRLAGALQAHPSVPGLCIYAVGSSVIAMFEGDPCKQVQLLGHDDAITALALSRSGALLASGQRGANADVVLWDGARLAASGSAVQRCRFQEHDLEVCALGFSHDERLLATVGNERERRVFVLDTSNGKIVTNTMLLEPKRTKAIAWSPASGVCYSFATAADMDTYLYNVDPHKGWINCEKVVAGSVRRQITCLCFSADGAWLFAGTSSGDVLSINVARKAVQLMHPVAPAGVGALLLHNSGQLLVGSADGSIRLFSFQQPGPCQDAPPVASVPGAITAMSAADGGASLLVGTRDGDVFAISSGGCGGPRVTGLMQSQLGAMLDLVWAPGAPSSLATASEEGTVCVWDAASLGLECRVVQQSTPDGCAAQSVALSPELLLSGWADGYIRCHARSGPKRGAALWSIPSAHATAHASGVPALQFSNSGAFIASGGAGGELRVWDICSKGELVAHMKHHSMPITDLKVVDDTHLLAACEDRTCTLWDIGAERLQNIFRASMGAVRGVAMSPDQVSVVTVGLDRAVIIWDVRQPGTPARTIKEAHAREISCVAINAAGNLIATGGADAAVRLWDWRSTGAPLGSFAAHGTGTAVSKLQFSPTDAGQLASAGRDGTLVLWQLT